MAKVHSLINRFNRRCNYCNCVVQVSTLTDPHHATVDHDIPKARGGTNTDSNRVLCCLRCNNVKSDMTGDEFRYFLGSGKLAQSYVDYLTARLQMRMAGRAEIVVHRDFTFKVTVEKAR